ncbi:hypothetical protein CR513_21233, partial [Mucuna pruriens]
MFSQRSRNFFFLKLTNDGQRFACNMEGLKFQVNELNRTRERKNTLVPIFKNKRYIHNCTNCRSIKLMSHTIKLWENISKQNKIHVFFIDLKNTYDQVSKEVFMEDYGRGRCLHDLHMKYTRHRQILETKSFHLNRRKTKYMHYNFSNRMVKTEKKQNELFVITKYLPNSKAIFIVLLYVSLYFMIVNIRV